MSSDSPARLLHFVIGFLVGAPVGVLLGGRVGGAIAGCAAGVLAFLFLDPLIEAVVAWMTGSEDDG